jgi:hypothetical protein
VNFKPASIPDIARGAWQGDPTSPALAALGDAGRIVVVVTVTRAVEASRVSAGPLSAATGRQP